MAQANIVVGNFIALTHKRNLPVGVTVPHGAQYRKRYGTVYDFSRLRHECLRAMENVHILRGVWELVETTWSGSGLRPLNFE